MPEDKGGEFEANLQIPRSINPETAAAFVREFTRVYNNMIDHMEFDADEAFLLSMTALGVMFKFRIEGLPRQDRAKFAHLLIEAFLIHSDPLDNGGKLQ